MAAPALTPTSPSAVDFSDYHFAYDETLALTDFPTCLQFSVERMRWLATHTHLSYGSILGKGSYGVVHFASYLFKNKQTVPCAVKFFNHPGYAEALNVAARRHEANMLWKTAGIDSAVRLHGFVQDQNGILNGLVIDYIEGPCLSKIQFLPHLEIVALAKQLFTYLAAIQTPAVNRPNGLIHGDLKGENLFWLRRKLIVIDLSMMQEKGKLKNNFACAESALPPEILLNQEDAYHDEAWPAERDLGRFDERLDVWAAAAVIDKLVTHHTLVNGANNRKSQLIETIKKIGLPSAAYLKTVQNTDRYFTIQEAIVQLRDTESVSTSSAPFEEAHVNCVRSSPLLLDLLKQCLRIDPAERISVPQALSHPLFKTIDK